MKIQIYNLVVLEKQKSTSVVIKRFVGVCLLVVFAMLFCSCGNKTISDNPTPTPIDPKSPEAFIEKIIKSVQNGSLDTTQLTLGKDEAATIKEPNKYPNFKFGM